MTKEFIYDERSWEATTRKIKQHFGWKELTKQSAERIMSLYLKGVDVEKMIEILKGEKK